MDPLKAPVGSDEWVGLTDERLPIDSASRWAVMPSCGAIVSFTGTSRDHSEGRAGVSLIEYEAYVEHVEPRLQAIVDTARTRWSDLGRLVLLHRVGEVPVGESSVLVIVSAPHRDEAFAAARFGIDTLKSTVPIWKREVWSDGVDWALDAHPIDGVDAVRS